MTSASEPMRILIGCEVSGVVRRAFANLGHDAWSCDIQPAAAMADQWGGDATQHEARMSEINVAHDQGMKDNA